MRGNPEGSEGKRACSGRSVIEKQRLTAPNILPDLLLVIPGLNRCRKLSQKKLAWWVDFLLYF
jgi:hypothetical protein